MKKFLTLILISSMILLTGCGEAEKIREAIETIKDLKVGTGVITMDATTHNPIKGIVVLETKERRTFTSHENCAGKINNFLPLNYESLQYQEV